MSATADTSEPAVAIASRSRRPSAIWLIPLVPLVRGRRGVAASAVLAVALLLTQLWFPYRYWRLALQQDAIASWLVLARDLVLVLLVVVLAIPRRALARTT